MRTSFLNRINKLSDCFDLFVPKLLFFCRIFNEQGRLRFLHGHLQLRERCVGNLGPQLLKVHFKLFSPRTRLVYLYVLLGFHLCIHYICHLFFALSNGDLHSSSAHCGNAVSQLVYCSLKTATFRILNRGTSDQCGRLIENDTVIGLFFTFFTNPSQLLCVVIFKPRICVSSPKLC